MILSPGNTHTYKICNNKYISPQFATERNTRGGKTARILNRLPLLGSSGSMELGLGCGSLGYESCEKCDTIKELKDSRSKTS